MTVDAANGDDSILTPLPSDPPQRLPLWKRGLEHSMKIAICCYAINTGLMLLMRVVTGGELPATLAQLPIVLVIALCAFTAAGGLISLLGLFSTAVDLRKQLNSEQLGWLLMGIGWAAYVIAAITYAPTVNIIMSVAPWLALGSLGRFIWLALVERVLDTAAEEG